MEYYHHNKKLNTRNVHINTQTHPQHSYILIITHKAYKKIYLEPPYFIRSHRMKKQASSLMNSSENRDEVSIEKYPK